MNVLYSSPGISGDIFLELFKNQKRRCDGRVTVNASTLQGFGTLARAIVLIITVYKTLYYNSGGSL